MDYRGVWFGRSIIAITPAVESSYRMEYFLGLLNSNLFVRYYRDLVHEEGRVFAQVKLSKIRQLPIRRIDFGNSTDKAMHDGLVALVERMLALQERLRPLRGTGLSEEQDLLAEIARVDREIDGVVYELYGLTEGERRLVEGDASRI